MTFERFKTISNYFIDNGYFNYMLLDDIYKYHKEVCSGEISEFINDIALRLQIEYNKSVYVVTKSDVTHFNAVGRIRKPTDLFIIPKNDMFVVIDSYEPDYFSKSSDDDLLEYLKYYKIPTLGFCYKQTICFY